MEAKTGLTPVFGIFSAYQFWDEVVRPTWIVFNQHPAPKEAFNVTLGLWHLLDWVTADPTVNPSVRSLYDVRKAITPLCPALDVLHDIITLGKHQVLSRPRGMVASTDVNLLGATLHFGPGGPVSEHPAEYKITLVDGHEFEFKALLAEAMTFWDQFFRQGQTVESIGD